MGFWKNVSYDIQNGMSKEKAVEINSKLRYGTPKEKKEAKKEEDKFYLDKWIDEQLSSML